MRRPPRLLRLVLRAPVLLYRAHLGWLLGRRFLMLTHVGRRTGREYRTVVEVVGVLPSSGEYVVMSGFGAYADWLRNLMAGGGGSEDARRRLVRQLPLVGLRPSETEPRSERGSPILRSVRTLTHARSRDESSFWAHRRLPRKTPQLRGGMGVTCGRGLC
jgi:deazaflavin-dependent oxidoreductase (nitroreductase family)